MVFLGKTLSIKIPRYKLARFALALRQLKIHKDNLRELEESTDEDIEEPLPNIDSPTLETSHPIEFNGTDIKPTIEENTNTTAGFQIKKFYNFQKPKGSKKLKLNVFFYFLNKPIVRTIVLRLTIVYKRRLRFLQDIEAESARTICNIKPGYEHLIGEQGNGINVDYDCSATTLSDAEISNAALNTTSPLVIGNESISYSEINFDDNSAEEAANLANEEIVQKYKEAGILENTLLELPFNRDFFRFNGTLIPKNILKQNESIPFEFYDFTNGGRRRIINCYVEEIIDSNCTIKCDTSKQTIKMYPSNLTLATSMSETKYIKINTDPDQNQQLGQSIVENSIKYRKNSSGLSGGAIAGIVITCVVVIIAASIAAIMLRKPKTQGDNTTVVGLKTIENI